MRRVIGILLVVGLSFSTIGCIAAVGNRGALELPGRQAVVLNGEIYIVDLDDGGVCKVDPDAIVSATKINCAKVEIEE